MILHYHPTSPYSRKVAVGLRLRRDPVERRVVDVTAGEHRGPAFLALSPFGKLPVLVDDAGVWFESTTILEHVEARRPAGLLPADGAGAARRWDRLGDLYLLEPQGTLFFSADADARTDALRAARTALRLLAEALADGRPWLLGGDAPTLADLSTGVGADQLALLGVDLPEPVARWLARFLALPEVAEEREAGMPLTRALLAQARALPAG